MKGVFAAELGGSAAEAEGRDCPWAALGGTAGKPAVVLEDCERAGGYIACLILIVGNARLLGENFVVWYVYRPDSIVFTLEEW